MCAFSADSVSRTQRSSALLCLDPWQPRATFSPGAMIHAALGASCLNAGALPLWSPSQHTQAGNIPCVHKPAGVPVPPYSRMGHLL